jgi:hypothetical protein
MTILRFAGYPLGLCVAASLAGCGGSQPPIGAPDVMPQSSAISRDGSEGPDLGTVFVVSTSGDERVLYRFAQSGGINPPTCVYEKGLVKVCTPKLSDAP